MPRGGRRFLGTATLGTLLFVVAPARATPPDTYGFGIRSTALAGAVSADVSDTSANYHNPAGLAAGDGLRLSVAYASLSPRLSINGQRSDVERFGMMQVGVAAPVRIGSVTLAFGLGLILPDQRVARTRSVVVDRPRWELYDTRSQRIYLSSHLALRPVSWLSFGAGITFQAPSELTLDLEGELNFSDPVEASSIRHQFEGDLTSIRYPQAGVQIRPHPRVAIGVTYRGAYEVTSTINATALADIVLRSGAAALAQLDFALRSASTSLYGPQQLSLGAALRPTDDLRVGLELTWIDWSKHPSLISTNDIALGLEPPLLEIPEEITALEPMDLGLRDVFVPRISVEQTLRHGRAQEIDLRAGYAYERSPFPRQRGLQNFVDGDKHHLALGVGVRFTELEPTLPGALTLQAYALLIQVRERTHTKESLVDPVGDYVSGGQLFGFGLGLEAVFE